MVMFQILLNGAEPCDAGTTQLSSPVCRSVQLNALFCCLCHKHFVVFFHNQHRRLLPAMCHNLRVGGRRPPATLLTTPSMLQR